MELEKTKCNACGNLNAWSRFKWPSNSQRKEHNRKNSKECPKCGSTDVSNVEDRETVAVAGFAASLILGDGEMIKGRDIKSLKARLEKKLSSPEMIRTEDMPVGDEDGPKHGAPAPNEKKSFDVGNKVVVTIAGPAGGRVMKGIIDSVIEGCAGFYSVRVGDAFSMHHETELSYDGDSFFLWGSDIPIDQRATAKLQLCEIEGKLSFSLSIKKDPVGHDKDESMYLGLSEVRARALVVTLQQGLATLEKHRAKRDHE